MNATREEIIAAYPLEIELPKRGFELRRAGVELKTLCPFHEDRSPSLRINPAKRTWFCDPCGKGGSVIDFVAAHESISIGDAMKKLGEPLATNPSAPPASGKPKIVATYLYHDELGCEVYQVVRLEPKSFRQRHMVEGKWEWKMDGVRRVLYNLPAVMGSKMVWIVEGEKDADTLNNAGASIVATCNVGGAGKWMDGYTESLLGKEIILLPDNDEPGKKHMKLVLDSLAGKVQSTRWINLPSPHKDVSDFVSSFSDRNEGVSELIDLAENAPPIRGGIDLPIKSMEELEHEFKEFVRNAENQTLNLGKFLPTLGHKVLGLVPGEVVTVLASTGVGKTYILQNIALCAKLTTVLFELELPGTLTFQRFVSVLHKRRLSDIWALYKEGGALGYSPLNNVFVCSKSKITVPEMGELVMKSELKTGTKAQMVMIDYAQLVDSKGSGRYERASSVAEDVRILAKETNTVVVMTSQVKREAGEEVSLFDGKDSGSIENSSSLVLGVWRDAEEPRSLMHMKILKNTKGFSGDTIRCRFDENMVIHEEAVTAAMLPLATRRNRAPRPVSARRILFHHNHRNDAA